MNLKIIAITIALYAASAQSIGVSVQFAQKKDIPAILNLNKKVIDEYFKPTIIAGYPDLLLAQDTEFLNQFCNDWNNMFETLTSAATSEEKNKNQLMLIAADDKNPDEVLGLCAFEKKENSIFIHYLIVSQQSRGKGIGKALLDTTLSSYKNINSCQLRTLANANESTQAFYEHYGFTSTKKLCTLDERLPNAHIAYELNIKK